MVKANKFDILIEFTILYYIHFYFIIQTCSHDFDGIIYGEYFQDVFKKYVLKQVYLIIFRHAA